MSSDLAAEARRHHDAILAARAAEAEHRKERDRLIHQMRAADPERWSYTAIGRAVGCGRDLAVFILRKPAP